MTRHVLITTDLDRTLLFSRRAIAQLGGGLPADPVETPAGRADAAAGEDGHAARGEGAGQTGAGRTGAGHAGAELSHAARDNLMALPPHARLCVATSRSVSRLARLRLPFAMPYAIAANGGVVLIDGEPDRGWAARIDKVMAAAAPAAVVRTVLAGPSGAGDQPDREWLIRMGDADDMCCLAIVELDLLTGDGLAAVAGRCAELGWEASLIGRKLYAFPAGLGKEHAAAYVAERISALTGGMPVRLAAGDTEHDRRMLADADRAWVPAGSELAPSAAGSGFAITREPGHAAAAQITADWLAHCRTEASPVS